MMAQAGEDSYEAAHVRSSSLALMVVSNDTAVAPAYMRVSQLQGKMEISESSQGKQ